MIAAWALFLITGKFGRAVAELIGIHSAWGYAIAIPPTTVIISWTVLWLGGGTPAMFGPAFAQIWPPTLAIAGAIFCVFFLLFERRAAIAARQENSTSESKDNAVGVAESSLHEHLPADFPPILAVSIEDHYVRVHAEDRSEMLLMPLAKAIELLPDNAGIRVHRSWWVARSAVLSHKREGRDVKLVLVDDLRVPISRNQIKELRRAGWIT